MKPPVDNDLTPEEHEALMTRPTDGWSQDDWEDLQDMAAPVIGVIVLLGVAFLVWRFGYLLS